MLYFDKIAPPLTSDRLIFGTPSESVRHDPRNILPSLVLELKSGQNGPLSHPTIIEKSKSTSGDIEEAV